MSSRDNTGKRRSKAEKRGEGKSKDKRSEDKLDLFMIAAVIVAVSALMFLFDGMTGYSVAGNESVNETLQNETATDTESADVNETLEEESIESGPAANETILNESSEPEINDSISPDSNASTEPETDESIEPETNESTDTQTDDKTASDGSTTDTGTPTTNTTSTTSTTSTDGKAATSGDADIAQGCDEYIDSCKSSGWVSGTTYCVNTSITTSGDCMYIAEDNITLDCQGHTISGDGGSYDYGIDLHGSYSDTSEHNTIENCIVDNFGRAVYLYYADYNNITNNTINNSYYNIYLYYYNDYNTIKDNDILLGSYGIYFYGSGNDQNILTGNEMNGSSTYAIEFNSGPEVFDQNLSGNKVDGYDIHQCINNNSWSLTDTKISGNRMTNYGPILLGDCDNALLDNITIAGHANTDLGYGAVYIYSSDNAKVLDSNLTGNRNGIRLEGSNSCHINNTLFDSNDNAGIYFYNNNDNNLIHENNFINNNHGIYIGSSGNDNNEITDNEFNGSTTYDIDFSSTSYLGQKLSGNRADGQEFHMCSGNSSWSLTDYTITQERVTNFGPMIIYNCDNAALDNITIKNHDYSDPGYGGLFIYSSDNARVRDSEFTDNENGIILDQSSGIQINNSLFDSNDNAGIYLRSNNDNNEYYHNDFTSNSYCFYFSSSGNNNNDMYSNEFNGSTTYDIDFYNENDLSDYDLLYNRIDGQDMHFCSGNSSWSLTDYEFTGGKVTNYGAIILRDCDNAALDNITIKNHNTADGGYGAVSVYSSDNIEIRDSDFTDNENGLRLDQSNNANITKTTFHSNDYSGIYIYSYNNENLFEDNEVTSNSNYGIYINQYNDRNVFSDNDITGHQYGIYISSAGNDDNAFYTNEINTSSTYGIYFGSFSYANQNFTGNRIDGYDLQYCRGNSSFSLSDYKIDIDRVSNYGAMMLYDCDNAVLDNVTAINHGYANPYYGGLTLYYSDNVTVTGSNFSNDETGIHIEESDRFNMTGTALQGNEDIGAHIEHSEGGRISGCNFTGHTGSYDEGIHLGYEVSGWNIEDNLLDNNYYNIYMYGSSGSNIIQYNNFTRNNLTSPSSSSGRNLYMYYYGENNRFYRNSFTDGPTYNYLYYYNDNNEFVENSFTGSSYMMRIYSSSNDNNKFYRNNFINTSAYSSPLASSSDSDNIFNNASPDGGNYWGNYEAVTGGACADVTPADGFCDTSYDINSNEKDNLPYPSQISANKAPQLTEPVLNSSQLKEDKDLQANTTYTDEEGTSGNVTFHWHVDNVNVHNETVTSVSDGSQASAVLANSNYSRDQHINVSVKSTDGELNSTVKWSDTILVVDAEMPEYSEFDGDTTDFLTEPDLSDVDSLVMENTSKGMISWLQDGRNVSDANFDAYMRFGQGWAWMDAANLNDNLNSSANITLYSLAFTYDPVPLSDGQACPDCTALEYSGGNFTFNVTHFTNYSAGANSNLTIYDEYEGSQAGKGENITFYANYTNTTSGEHIAGADCRIGFDDGTSGWMTEETSRYNYTKVGGFGTAATHTWNVTCNRTGYERLNTTDDVNVVLFTGNAYLGVFDDNDPEGGSQGREYGQLTMFYANYSNITDGTPVTTGTCTIEFGDEPGVYNPMGYNATSKYHEYNRTFDYADNVSYEVNCTDAVYDYTTREGDIKIQCPAGTLEITGPTNFTGADTGTTAQICRKHYNLSNYGYSNGLLQMDGAYDFILDCNNASFDGSSGSGGSTNNWFYDRTMYDNITVRNCTVRNYGYGINIYAYSAGTKYDIFIHNNTFHNTSLKEDGSNLQEVYIRDNSFHGSPSYIDFQALKQSELRNNLFDSTQRIRVYGLRSDGADISGNTITNGLDESMLYVYQCRCYDINITNNTITGSMPSTKTDDVFGALTVETWYLNGNITNMRILDNTITGNAGGLYIETLGPYPSWIEVKGNNISNNTNLDFWLQPGPNCPLEMDSSNTAGDGNPLLYYNDSSSITIEDIDSAGELVLCGITDSTVRNITFSQDDGLLMTNSRRVQATDITSDHYRAATLYKTNDSNITGLTSTGAYTAVMLLQSENNTFTGADLTDADNRGFYLKDSEENNISQSSIDPAPYGAYIDDSSYNIIDRTNISDATEYGICITGDSDHNTVTGSRVRNSTRSGILINRTPQNNLIVSTSLFENEEHGIELKQTQASYTTVQACDIYRNRNSGIYMNVSGYNTIKGSRITNNTDSGIAIDRPHICSSGSVCTSDTQCGWPAGECTGGEPATCDCFEYRSNNITDNNITDQDSNTGISLSRTSDNLISGNRITAFATGLEITNSSNDTISLNYVCGNTLDISQDSPYLDNGTSNRCDSILEYDDTDGPGQGCRYSCSGPIINSIQCEIGGSFKACTESLAGDDITKVRADCTSPSNVTNASFTLTHINTSHTYFSDGYTTDNSTGYWEYDNSDVRLNRTGAYLLNVTCFDNSSQNITDSVQWSVKGSLLGYLLAPYNDSSAEYEVVNGSTFTFNSRVTCADADCGNVTAILDPAAEDIWTKVYPSCNGTMNFSNWDTVEYIFGPDGIPIVAEYEEGNWGVYYQYAYNESGEWENITSPFDKWWGAIMATDGIGNVIAHDYSDGTKLYRFDRSAKQWQPIADPTSGNGCDYLKTGLNGSILCIYSSGTPYYYAVWNGTSWSSSKMMPGGGTMYMTGSYSGGTYFGLGNLYTKNRTGGYPNYYFDGFSIWNASNKSWGPVFHINPGGSKSLRIFSNSSFRPVMYQRYYSTLYDYYYYNGTAWVDSNPPWGSASASLNMGGNTLIARTGSGPYTLYIWNTTNNTWVQIADPSGGSSNLLATSDAQSKVIMLWNNSPLNQTYWTGVEWADPAWVEPTGQTDFIFDLKTTTEYGAPWVYTATGNVSAWNMSAAPADESPGIPKTVVPMHSGTPFYTTSDNPSWAANMTCLDTMNAGDTCNVSWNVTANGPINATYQFFVIFNSTKVDENETKEVNITITDGGAPPADNPPTWSNNQSSIVPAHSPSAESRFNITWQDDNGISEVRLESNYSGSAQNYTMNRISGDATDGVYNYSAVAGAGVYYWKSHANDTAGPTQWNTTDTWTFSIDKAAGEVLLYLNSSRSDLDAYNGTYANITAVLAAGAGDIQVNVNGTQIHDGVSPSEDMIHLNKTVTYRITAEYAGNANFTSDSETWDIEVTLPSEKEEEEGGGGGGTPTGPPEPQDITFPEEPVPIREMPPPKERIHPAPDEAEEAEEAPSSAPSSAGPAAPIHATVSTAEKVSCDTTIEIVERERPAEEVLQTAGIPEGFDLVVTPFSANCRGGETFKTNIITQDKYKDLRVLRCTGDSCRTEKTKYVRDICADQIVCSVREESVFNISTAPVNITYAQDDLDAGEALQSGDYRIGLASGGKASISMPEEDQPQPANMNVRIVGTPLELSYEPGPGDAEEGQEQGQTAEVTLPYRISFNDDEQGVAVYAKSTKDGRTRWAYIGGEVDAERDTVTASVDLSAHAQDGSVILAPITMYCPDCGAGKFELKHTPEPDTRQAVIMVHGLWSEGNVWDSFVNDFRLTNQPYQIWTYAYDATKTLDESAQDLAGYIEANNHRYDRIYIVGYSLGGLVARSALSHAHSADQENSGQYSFIDKVSKAIILGAPNTGTPIASHIGEFITEYINTEATDFLPLHPLVKDVLEKGTDAEPVPGIDYYVIAGTKPYEFMDRLGLTRLVFGDEKNDGVVPVSSVQKLGTEVKDERCINYWSSPTEHTMLNDDPYIYQLIGQIISSDVFNALVSHGKEEELFGYTKNIELQIEDCAPDDVYYVIGKPAEEVDRAAYCSCGNGICDGLESRVTCPEDCKVIRRPSNYGWLFALLLLIILLIGGGTSVYSYYRRKIEEGWNPPTTLHEINTLLARLVKPRSKVPKQLAKEQKVHRINLELEEQSRQMNKTAKAKTAEQEKKTGNEREEGSKKLDEKLRSVDEKIRQKFRKLKTK